MENEIDLKKLIELLLLKGVITKRDLELVVDRYYFRDFYYCKFCGNKIFENKEECACCGLNQNLSDKEFKLTYIYDSLRKKY